MSRISVRGGRDRPSTSVVAKRDCGSTGLQRESWTLK